MQGAETTLTSGGAPVYIWPGGGITMMVDVTTLPERSFGYVPTPALVAPLEFTLPRAAYAAMGGHEGAIREVEDVLASGGDYGDAARSLGARGGPAWPPRKR